MRESTEKERASVQKYIDSISERTIVPSFMIGKLREQLIENPKTELEKGINKGIELSISCIEKEGNDK